MTMDVLVIGGAGFIGRWVVKRLLALGNDVHVLDNLSWGEQQIRNVEEFKGNPHFFFHRGDIEKKKDLETIFKTRFDVCIHMASFNIVQKSIDDPSHAFNTDVLGTFQVLEECRKTKLRVLFVSTCMVYDLVSGKPIDEHHPIKPISPYSAAKIAAENLALSYHYTYHMDVSVLRPFNTYGPFGLYPSGEGTVIPRFLKNLLDKKPLEIFGDGLQTRDFLYVEDTAEFIVAAVLAKGISGEIINGGYGREISIKDLASLIQPDPKMIHFVTHHHPQSDVRRLLCDNRKAKRLLGWTPHVDLEAGIKKTLAWMKEHPVIPAG